MNDLDQTVILPRQRDLSADPSSADAATVDPVADPVDAMADPEGPAQVEVVGDSAPAEGDTCDATAVESRTKDDSEQTAVLPRLDDSHRTPAARVDAWDVDAVPRGTAPVTGVPFGRARALSTLAWLFAAMLTATLAMIRLSWASMRAPELAGWVFTTTPWHLIPRLIHDTPAGDVPYFIFLKAWSTVFGRSDFALRMPSVVAMSAAAGLLAVLATRLAGPRAGLLAGLLFAAIPGTSRYAQEVGPGAFTVFAAVLATLAMVALFNRPSFLRTVGYLAALALLGSTSLTGVVVVVVHGLVVLSMKRTVLFRWLVAVIFGAAPAVVIIVLARVYPWRVPGDPVPGMPTVDQLATGTFGAVLVAGILLGLGLLAMSPRKPAIVFTGWAMLPLVLLPVIIKFTTVDADQVVLLTLPGWVGLGGMGLCRTRVVRAIAATLVVALVGLPAQLAIRRPDGHGQASHQLADILYTQAKPGDVMMFGPGNADGPAGRDIVRRYLSAAHRPKDVLALAEPGADGHRRTPECIDVDKCLGPAARVWLIRVGADDAPLTGLEAGKDGALRVRYVVARTWQLTGVSLTLFTLKPKS